MTLADALTEAQRRPGRDTLAVWVRDALSEAQPCGTEPPEIVVRIGERLVRLPETWPRWMTPSEARAHAAMLLHAADQAEQ